MKDWKREILDGVGMVSFPGCVPGVMFVYGENSQAILANKRGHVLCAAAEYGKGRIIVFSHNVFVNSFGKNDTKRKNKRFNENIRNWMTKNTDKGNEIPCFSDYFKEFYELPPECRILTWNGLPVRTEDQSVLKLLDWVEKGGGLICGVCPWGFAEVYKIDVESIPLNIIFRAIGIAYADKIMYKNDGDLAELLVKDNMADYAKPSDLVSAINKHPEKINRLGGLIHNVVNLPEELYIKHKPHVVEMIQKLSPDNDHIPTRSKPVESHGAKKAAMLICDIMIRDGLEGNVVLAEGIHEFPGTFEDTPEDQNKERAYGRGQWVVTDEQPSIGYMHSGYPIVTHLDMADTNKIYEDCFLLSRDHILKVNNRKGSWGMFHELGHNFHDSMWTWDGTKEVTCNIFTLHAMDVVCNVKPWEHLWVREKFENASNYLREGSKYDKWFSNAGIALLVYAQLARDFGWGTYKSVFRTYDKLPKDKRPSNQQEKENMWIQTFSNVVKRNLSLVFEFWGWPIRGLDDLKRFSIPP
ncbi:TRPM8 channel-associated factor homolog [Mytilus trossulus]|uniref:TRPM8 channel-associated factor homolog n=1 Tax=Mytilus trossulus TaxID=6551 RepID=UPI003006A954